MYTYPTKLGTFTAKSILFLLLKKSRRARADMMRMDVG